jgi:hypothetical protein
VHPVLDTRLATEDCGAEEVVVVDAGIADVAIEHRRLGQRRRRGARDLVDVGDGLGRLVVVAGEEPAGRAGPLDVADAGAGVNREVLRLAVAQHLRREPEEERLAIALEREHLRGAHARRIGVLEAQHLLAGTSQVQRGGAGCERRACQGVGDRLVAGGQRERRPRVARSLRNQVERMPVRARVLLERPAQQHGAARRELCLELVGLHHHLGGRRHVLLQRHRRRGAAGGAGGLGLPGRRRSGCWRGGLGRGRGLRTRREEALVQQQNRQRQQDGLQDTLFHGGRT